MRKLAWASIPFCATIALCHYVLSESVYIWFIFLSVIFGVCSVVFLRDKMRVCTILLCVFSVLGLLRYAQHNEQYLDVSALRTDHDYRITAYVVEYPVIDDEYVKVVVRLKTDLLPEVKTVLYDYDNVIMNPEQLQPGYMVRTSVCFASASVVSGEETDTYLSKGIYLRGYFRDDITCYENKLGRLLVIPTRVGYEIRCILEQYLTERASAFMKALLTGDKTALYEMPEINRLLSNAGISHVVAVSGMHVSFLVGLILVLFGNKYGICLSGIAVLLFAIMTGLSPSVIRAALMQMLYLSAPVLRRESDAMTSISFALLMILLVNPFAVASISLQLSFAAMLGIILVTPKLIVCFDEFGKNTKGMLRKSFVFVSSSLAASFGAILFTTPLCAMYFGNISLLAPLTNLLVLWIVPWCFGGGFLLCLTSFVSEPLTQILGTIISNMVEFIYVVSELISAIPNASVYLPDKLMVFWMLCVSVIIIICMVLKGRKTIKVIAGGLVSYALLLVLCFSVKAYYNDGTTIAAIDVGQGQCIAVLNDETTVLIDCGGDYNAGQTVVEWLKSHGRESVDLLVLTHCDTDHVNGITDVMLEIPIHEIRYNALNLSEYEAELLLEIKDYAEQCGTQVVLNNKTQEINFEQLDLTLYVPKNPKGNNGIMVLAQINDFDMLITGDADMKTETEFMNYLGRIDGECYVVGHHGSKYSTSDLLLDRFQPDFSIISCGYNHFGHPTQEVLDRLNSRNVIIYRTDIMGSVEMKVR